MSIQHAIPAVALAAFLVAPAFAAEAFSLSSPELKPEQTLAVDHVFKGFGCDGGNRSPALSWTPGPADTKSYALTAYDPDAPTGSGWWHWVLYNIPAAVTSLPADAGHMSGEKLPAGAVQGRTDFGTHAFGGACPPAGDKPHRYIFTVYALKADRLELPADASAALIGFMIHANTLDKAALTARYGR